MLMAFIKSILSKLLLFLVLVFCVQIANTQNRVVFENISQKAGLPEGAVNCLEQDQTGFVWIGTWKGLFRYDGYNAINFSTINPKFSALKIKSMLVNGNDLWVGTFVSGLFCINLETYEVEIYNTDASKNRQISENNIISLCVLPDSTILAGTERGGLNIIGADYAVSTIYTKEKNSDILVNNQVSALEYTYNNTVAIGNSAFALFDIENQKITPFSYSEFNAHIAGITAVSDSEFLIYTLDKLYLLNIKNQNESSLSVLLDMPVKNIVPKTSGQKHLYYIGTVNGLYLYNANTRKIDEYLTQSSGFSPKFEINVLLFTTDNVLMVGAESGLYSIVSRAQIFSSINTNITNDSPDIVSNIVQCSDNLFAGTWGKGLFQHNSKTNILEPVRFTNYNTVPRFIFSMISTDDKLWFSSKNELGVFSFSPQSRPYKLQYHQTFIDQNNREQIYTVTSMLKTSSGILLAGTWEGLLFYYNELLKRFEILTMINGELPLSENISINSLLEDNAGNIWVALGGGGVLKIAVDGKKVASQQLITTENGLCSNFATALYQSKNNKVWIGTEAGLSVCDENGKIESMYHRNYILDIQSIIEDQIGYLWMGTQRGLARMNSNNTNDPIKIFDQLDGLQSSSYFLNSVCADNDYTFYFGGYDGIDYFTPYKIDYNFNKPTPHITSFSLFNQKVYPANKSAEERAIEKNIFFAHEICLAHNQNTFSFEFSNLEYTVQNKCQFAFMLSGVDIDWNYRSAEQRYAYYTKISPGTYTFYLKSTNNDGVWSDEPLALQITITPPFWKSTLAYIVYFVLAMVIVFSAIYLRFLKVQQKHRQKLKEIEYKKEKELDELKLRFFTNISHEFRTPLTLILGPLAKILENEKNDKFRESHLMIFRNANRLLHLTNRIMEFRKNEKAQLKLRVEPTVLSDFVYNIFLFFNYEAQKRDIDYRFKTQHEGTVLIDREYVESVLFNLLSNAFKYTPDGKSIYVTLWSENDFIKIEIADTGCGINPNDLENIFKRFYSTSNINSSGVGLSFSQRLMQLHKGNIEVKSTYGQSSQFIVSLPATDVYSLGEKKTEQQAAQFIDWKKVNYSVKKSTNTKIDNLKNVFGKDEMIALIVDDNVEVREFLRSLLENNFRIFEASNGAEALEIALNEIPDIVISDVMMPKMNGLKLCEKLKTDSRTDHVPVILTTVLSGQDDRIKGLTHGADSYIPKPIDPNHLLVRVNKLIEKQLKLKEKFHLDNIKQLPDNDIESREPEIHPMLEKARNIVLENLDNSSYNVDDFCNDLGLSRMQLYRKFKAIAGLSANSFIRKVRLHEAARMLKTGEYSIKEVTYDVGFIDLKYFRKCFHAEFGVNPSEYVRKNTE